MGQSPIEGMVPTRMSAASPQRKKYRAVYGAIPEATDSCVRIPYGYLVLSPFALSRCLRTNPAQLIVFNAPDYPYAHLFAATLAASKFLPYDVPGRPFRMVKTPEIIFHFYRNKPVDTPDSFVSMVGEW